MIKTEKITNSTKIQAELNIFLMLHKKSASKYNESIQHQKSPERPKNLSPIFKMRCLYNKVKSKRGILIESMCQKIP